MNAILNIKNGILSKIPPFYLIAGYLSIGIFMTGDGFEQAFLSHYLVSMGFTQSNASLTFTLYGFCAGLAAWSAGILAEMFGPRLIMLIGATIWLIFHALFLHYGLSEKNYYLILLFYCFRAIGYPLFVYAFVVWFTRTIPENRLALAMGWYWTMFIFGIGFMGSYVPSFTIPIIGELKTLWLAMVVVFIGALIGYLALRSRPDAGRSKVTTAKEKVQQLSRGIMLAFESRSMFVAFILMMLDPMALFGFAVMMPFLFIDTLGFSSSEWLKIWSMTLLANMIMNIVTGAFAGKIGWLRVIRWMGFVGVACTTLMYLYIPSYFGHNMTAAIIVAVLHGTCFTGFTPLSAVFPALAPKEKGAAISLHNLAVGLGSCIGPGIATALLPLVGIAGVVWTYSALYIVCAGLSFLIKLRPVMDGKGEPTTMPLKPALND